MTLELLPLATLHIAIVRQTLISDLPAGRRFVGEAADSSLSGPRVRARQWGQATSDWVTIHADDSVSVDARLLFVTDDGAHLAMTYRGKATAPPATGAPVYVTPTFETDDPRYRWLNHVQAVAKGRRDGTDLTYEIYELR